MLFKPKNVPPEPYYSASIFLIYWTVLHIRNNANVLSWEQVSDLAEAIHNVPETLTEYGHYFDEQKIRDSYLAAYDRKWMKSPDDFSLVRTLDNAINHVREWQDRTGGSVS